MRVLIIIFITLMQQLSFAAALSDAPQFSSPEENARYQRLIKQTRCPTCQNSDISESNAPVARQLREQIARQIIAGQSDAEIGVFLHDRYGDFITYDPPVKAKTLILWFAPFVIMLLTLGWFLFSRQKKMTTKTLSAAEKAELEKWLQADKEEK